jgi:hypothetical protein
MKNRIFFPTSGAAKTALALRMNAIVKCNTNLLLTERDDEVVQSIVADVARANDIMVNFMGFGSIKSDDIQWVCDCHDRNDLWTSEDVLAQEQSFVRLMLENILGKKSIWYDVDECEWNVNMTADDAMPEFTGYLSEACDFVGDSYNG